MSGFNKMTYVPDNLKGIVDNLTKIASQLNINLWNVILNPKYRDDDYIKQELEKAKIIIKKEENFNRINERLRDSLIFDKCNESTLKLDMRGMHKQDILNQFKDELELLKLSNLSKQSKNIQRKKIKQQMQTFKNTPISALNKARNYEKQEKVAREEVKSESYRRF